MKIFSTCKVKGKKPPPFLLQDKNTAIGKNKENKYCVYQYCVELYGFTHNVRLQEVSVICGRDFVTS